MRFRELFRDYEGLSDLPLHVAVVATAAMPFGRVIQARSFRETGFWLRVEVPAGRKGVSEKLAEFGFIPEDEEADPAQFYDYSTDDVLFQTVCSRCGVDLLGDGGVFDLKEDYVEFEDLAKDLRDGCYLCEHCFVTQRTSFRGDDGTFYEAPPTSCLRYCEEPECDRCAEVEFLAESRKSRLADNREWVDRTDVKGSR